MGHKKGGKQETKQESKPRLGKAKPDDARQLARFGGRVRVLGAGQEPGVQEQGKYVA